MPTRDDTMQVQVNGEPRTLAEGMTVAALLRELDIRQDRVAVELNLSILERSEFDRKNLKEGDRVEIISFIGGGSLRRSAVSRGRYLPVEDCSLTGESVLS